MLNHWGTKINEDVPIRAQGKPAVSCRWTGQVWGIPGWSWRLRRRITDHFRGIYGRIYLKWIKQTLKMSTSNWLDLEWLGSWPWTMPENFPGSDPNLLKPCCPMPPWFGHEWFALNPLTLVRMVSWLFQLLLLIMFKSAMFCHVDTLHSTYLIILGIIEICECALNWFCSGSGPWAKTWHLSPPRLRGNIS